MSVLSIVTKSLGAVLLLIPLTLNNAIAADCVSLAKDAEQTQAEAKRLQDLNEILTKLVSGTKIPDAPLTELFSVDITHASAVARRLAELEDELQNGTSKLTPVGAELLAACPVEGQQADLAKHALNAASEENARLRIAFYKQPASVRISLVSRQDLVDELKASQVKLTSEIEAQKQAKTLAKTKEIEETAGLQNLIDRDAKDLAAAKIQLEGAKADLAEFHGEWLRRVQEVVVEQKQAAEEVVLLSGRSMSAVTEADKRKVYLTVVPLWRRLIDSSFRVFDMAYNVHELPTLPTQPKALLERLSNTPAAKEYLDSYLDAEASFKKFAIDFKTESRVLADKQYHIQSQAAALRAQLYESVEDDPALEVQLPFDDLILDYWREIRSIPNRAVGLAYTKFLSYKSGINGNFASTLALARDIFVLLLVLSIPVVALFSLRRATHLIDRLRVKLAKNRKGTLDYALWLHRITPYLPWLTSLLAIKITQNLLAASTLEELTSVFEIAAFFLYYRMFRLIVRDVYHGLRLRIDMPRDLKANELIEGTAKLVGRFFLVASIILFTTRLAVGEVLVYGIVLSATKFLGIIVLAVAVRRWDFIIEPLAKTIFSPAVAERMARLCRGRFAVAFCLPILIVILARLAIARISDFLETFDASKRIIAKIYRRRIQARASEVEEADRIRDRDLPDEYKQLFVLDGLADIGRWTSGNDQELTQVKAEIDAWLSNDSAEQSTAIYGEKGSGKTALLAKIAATYPNLETIKVNIPAKTTTREACRKVIQDAFHLDAGEDLVPGLIRHCQKNSKVRTVVLIDDAHNLFLSSVGGLDGYEELVSIMNSEPAEIFWCLAFNIHAWTFLQGYYRNNQHIRSFTKLAPWSDDEISELILSRQKTTPFRLIFDQTIMSAQPSNVEDDKAYAEKQFFRLLWEQSKGNPRIAMQFWLTAVHLEGSRRLRVTLPEEPDVRVLERLSDDDCFVYAAIARHENLAEAEIARTLKVPLPSVALALKFGLENSLLTTASDRRFRLDPQWHNYVVAHLKKKNFLYGIE